MTSDTSREANSTSPSEEEAIGLLREAMSVQPGQPVDDPVVQVLHPNPAATPKLLAELEASEGLKRTDEGYRARVMLSHLMSGNDAAAVDIAKSFSMPEVERITDAIAEMQIILVAASAVHRLAELPEVVLALKTLHPDLFVLSERPEK